MNKNLSQLFEESSYEMMFDSRFKDSVANIRKCSQIDDSLPVKYVSQLYDSKLSHKVTTSAQPSHKSSMVKDKKFEDHSLEILVQKFLEKDKQESQPVKPVFDYAAKPPKVDEP